MFIEPFHVRLAAQEPEQFVEDRLEMQLLGGDEWEPFAQREARLRAEHGVSARARAVGLELSLIEHEPEQLMILKHVVGIVEGSPRIATEFFDERGVGVHILCCGNRPMNILVTGASGLVGSAACAALTREGHRVTMLRRGASGDGPSWAPEEGRINLAPAGPLDAVLHLAGETIAQRWTQKAKQRIRDSRVEGTRVLCEALVNLPEPPKTLVCASATGFYGDRGDEWLDESSAPGTGFLADTCQEWEAAAAPAARAGVRVVHLRFGLVLAKEGGALAKMLPAFKLGLGGRLGDGRAWWSWIAIGDLVRVIQLALTDDSLRGPVNAVAPHPVTNAEFTRALGRVLHRPAILPVPRFVIQTVFGEMGREALLGSARVRPAVLGKHGFTFLHGEIESALRAVLHP